MNDGSKQSRSDLVAVLMVYVGIMWMSMCQRHVDVLMTVGFFAIPYKCMGVLMVFVVTMRMFMP